MKYDNNLAFSSALLLKAVDSPLRTTVRSGRLNEVANVSFMGAPVCKTLVRLANRFGESRLTGGVGRLDAFAVGLGAGATRGTVGHGRSLDFTRGLPFHVGLDNGSSAPIAAGVSAAFAWSIITVDSIGTTRT